MLLRVTLPSVATSPIAIIIPGPDILDINSAVLEYVPMKLYPGTYFERNRIARMLSTNVGILEITSIKVDNAESIHVPRFIAARTPIRIAITVPNIVEKSTRPIVIGILSIIWLSIGCF